MERSERLKEVLVGILKAGGFFVIGQIVFVSVVLTFGYIRGKTPWPFSADAVGLGLVNLVVGLPLFLAFFAYLSKWRADVGSQSLGFVTGALWTPVYFEARLIFEDTIIGHTHLSEPETLFSLIGSWAVASIVLPSVIIVAAGILRKMYHSRM